MVRNLAVPPLPKRDPRPIDDAFAAKQWAPYYPNPPKGISFVVRDGYLPVYPGDENVSRFVPLVYDAARKDLSSMARIHVERAALEKIGPIYRGIFDSGGDPFVFSMSGKGVFTRAVEKAQRQQAWRLFQDLLDKEYMKSVRIMRRKS